MPGLLTCFRENSPEKPRGNGIVRSEPVASCEMLAGNQVVEVLFHYKG